MTSRIKELAQSVGHGWFVVVIGMAMSIYGAIELVVHAKTTGWAWITVGLLVLNLVTLNVAYQALKARDEAMAALGTASSSGARVIFQGGAHSHYYASDNPTAEEESESEHEA